MDRKKAHKIQEFLGVDCFWLARICLILSVPLFVFLPFGVFRNQYGLGLSLLGVLLSSIPTVMFAAVAKAESDTNEAHRASTANPAKITLLHLRLFGWFAILTSSMHSYGLFVPGMALILLSLYLASCDPLPPAKSKVRQWLKRMVAKVKDKLERTREFGAPEPEPALIQRPSH